MKDVLTQLKKFLERKLVSHLIKIMALYMYIAIEIVEIDVPNKSLKVAGPDGTETLVLEKLSKWVLNIYISNTIN